MVRLTFDFPIGLPAGPALSIINLHTSADVSNAFTYAVEPDGVTLKATETGPVLTNQNWYRLTPGAGLDVQPFVLDLCALQGDSDDTGQVLAQDYFPLKNNLFLVTDARMDLDGNGQVLAQDYFVVKNHLFHAKPPKP